MGIIIHQDGLLWSGNGGTGNGIPISEKGQPDGVATLDGEGRVPLGQLPDVTGGITLIQAQEEISSNIKINKSGYINPTANGINAVAIGSGSTSNGTNSFAVNGGYAVRNAIAIGTNTTTGTEAIALGINCNATASSSIAIGSNTQSLGINSLSIGITARASNSSAINYGVAIGYNCSTTGSYQIQVGGTAQTVYAYGAIQDRSDSRDKADIQACDLGLDFINALQPKKYKWDYREDYAKDKFPHLEREHFDSDESYQSAIEQQYQARCAFFQDPVKDGSKIRSRYHYGLIADDLKSTLEQLDIDFGGYQDHSINGGMCVKSIGYIELLAPLIKAVQELSAKVAALEISPH